jgi:hypothetical protein
MTMRRMKNESRRTDPDPRGDLFYEVEVVRFLQA